MSRGPALRAVLFDWDGTLVDSAEASDRSYVRLFSSFGIRFDRALFEAAYSPDWYRTHALVGLPRERWSGGFPNREALRSARPDLWAPGLAECVGELLVRRSRRR